MNNYLLIILDSCRYDTFIRANPRTMSRIGQVEKRWSYASWTYPSHCNLLMGLLPHSNPKHVYASEVYKHDFLKYNERLGTTGIEFKSMVPGLHMPAFLRQSLGYITRAMVSLPVLNPKTLLNQGFDSYELMKKHNDMRAMVHKLDFDVDQPSYYLLNVGETHYPYALPDEPADTWPRISGVHGVFKHIDEPRKVDDSEPDFFKSADLENLRDRQVEAVRYLDGVIEELLDRVPKNTYVTITADHGELFGEDGFFGHGPICHEKVLEVPLIEGKIR